MSNAPEIEVVPTEILRDIEHDDENDDSTEGDFDLDSPDLDITPSSGRGTPIPSQFETKNIKYITSIALQ